METVCQVCVHHCKLSPGQWGICRARRNEDGVIVCKNYGRLTALALDPIEKKPLKMFYPGSRILSVGSFGCNLRCPFCQNHEISVDPDPREASFIGRFVCPGSSGGGDFEEGDGISEEEGGNSRAAGGTSRAGEDDSEEGGSNSRAAGGAPETVFISPEELTKKALACREAGNIGVAFTYNEPLVGWEYVLDTAKLLRQNDMKVVLVTNGTLAVGILDGLLPYVDAMNIDLKGFREDYYRKLGGDLEAVKAFIVRSAPRCHVELTTLIVPNENDGFSDMEEEARWIASLAEIPLHVTRFFPRYRMQDRAATDVRRVYELAETARKYLKHVFVGNC